VLYGTRRYSMTAIYPVSLKKAWETLNTLPLSGKKDEIYRLIKERTSEAMAPLYFRALKSWNFISGERELIIVKPKEYIEFAKIVAEKILNELGDDFLRTLEELSEKNFSLTPEIISEELKKRGVKISTYKIYLALRGLNSAGALRKEIKFYIHVPKTIEDSIITMLRSFGKVNIQRFIERVSSRFFLSAESIRRVILKLIYEDRIRIINLSEVTKLWKNILVYLNLEPQIPIKVNIEKIKKIKPEYIKELAEKYNELIRIRNNHVIINGLWYSESLAITI